MRLVIPFLLFVVFATAAGLIVGNALVMWRW
jgi:hypothetical protein